MATLDDLYAVSRRLCFDVEEGLSSMEREERNGHSSGASGSSRHDALGRELRHRVSELKRITSEMERQWRAMAMTASISKSDTWKVSDARATRERRARASERDDARAMTDGERWTRHSLVEES